MIIFESLNEMKVKKRQKKEKNIFPLLKKVLFIKKINNKLYIPYRN